MVILAVAAMPIAAAFASLSPASLFQDGAVLQRDMPVPVWGRCDPGAEVTVAFAGQSVSATADATGRWLATLAPLAASADGRAMRLSSDTGGVVEINDVLVGEVWLGSGQSNMQWSIRQSRPEDQQSMQDAGDIPLLRLFGVPREVSHERRETVNASWQPATPENSVNFSAVAYFFGRMLTEELGVPVGMIHSSWGGALIEPWWAEEGLEGIEELAEAREARLARSPGFAEFDAAFREYVVAMRGWSESAIETLDAGDFPADMPKAPEMLTLGHRGQAGTYQAMIHPLTPYALRGFLWYQGESNNGDDMLYTTKKRALIEGWRKNFRNPQAPFLFVQLAPFNYGGPREGALPRLWWAQQATLEIPHTGMAVTNDIGNIRDIHPGNKSEVARRLALWALADTYGRTDLVKSGPLFKNHEVTGEGVVIRFDHVGGGLVSRDGKPLSHFEVAGDDGAYHPAVATVSGDGKSILLTSPDVPRPTRARFAWSQLAEPNLMNREGLPAPAFDTHWPEDGGKS